MIKRKSKTSQTCNLIQTDISTAINKWREIARMKMIKKKNALVKSAIVIDIDSDSESAFENSEKPARNVKRALAVPFSDDEDDQNVLPVQLRNERECKRTLAVPFSDAEDEDQDMRNTIPLQSKNGNLSTTPKPIVKKTKTRETIGKIQPIASSTPLPSLRHVSSRKNAQTDCSETLSENESTISESTIIYEQEYSSNKTDNVIIKEQIIIPSHNGGKPKMAPSIGKKRAAENDRDGKKQKIQQSVNGNEVKKTTLGDKEIAKGKKNLNWRSKITQPSCSKSSNSSNSNIVSKSDKGGTPKIHQRYSKSNESPSTYTTDVTRRLGDSMNCTNQTPTSTPIAQNNNKSVPQNMAGVKQNLFKQKSTNTTTPTKSNDSNKGTSSTSKKKSPLKSQTTKTSTAAREESLPKKKRVNDNTPSCTQSPRNSSVKTETKGKKPDKKRVQLITELFKTVYQTTYLKDLISTDKEKINLFLKMDSNYQFVCLSLITRKRKWYNIFKFCDLLNLKIDIDEADICGMYNFFKDNKMIDTDYIQDDISKLLNLLNQNDLKDICKIYKSYPIATTKDERINSLLKCCRQQTNLTSVSTEDLIKKEIRQKMGKYVMRLNEEFDDTFYRTYLMGTFTNPLFSKIPDYFMYDNVVFPEYPVQDHIIFYTKEEFIRYARARKCRGEIEKLGSSPVEILKISRMAFEELKNLKDIELLNQDRYKNIPHLMQFTARYVYVSVLTTTVKTLATKYPDDAQQWLEYMIRHESKFTHRIGEWCDHLTWHYMRYAKPRDYERAARLLVRILEQYKPHLSEVQLYRLEKRGRDLKKTDKYKISQLLHDKIAGLVPRRIKDLPQTSIDAHTVRENKSGRKRDYIVRDKEGNKDVMTVEQFALQHYLTNGYTGGRHCEGDLVKATFTLFFWDIIYMDIPASFVTKNQSEPLDMYTKYFYLRRKDAIKKRLKEIESVWSHSEVIEWLYSNYENHSHKLGFCQPDVSEFIEECELLNILVECVGRRILAKIYERLVKNIRHNRSGMPDLLVWNSNTKKSKFVEVKGENDTLSIGQSLWIKYLQNIGADVEVCHVHSIGSKKKKIVKATVNAAEPSTSSIAK